MQEGWQGEWQGEGQRERKEERQREGKEERQGGGQGERQGHVYRIEALEKKVIKPWGSRKSVDREASVMGSVVGGTNRTT